MKRCRCCEKKGVGVVRDKEIKVGGYSSLSHTRWSGVRG